MGGKERGKIRRLYLNEQDRKKEGRRKKRHENSNVKEHIGESGKRAIKKRGEDAADLKRVKGGSRGQAHSQKRECGRKKKKRRYRVIDCLGRRGEKKRRGQPKSLRQKKTDTKKELAS